MMKWKQCLTVTQHLFDPSFHPRVKIPICTQYVVSQNQIHAPSGTNPLDCNTISSAPNALGQTLQFKTNHWQGSRNRQIVRMMFLLLGVMYILSFWGHQSSFSLVVMFLRLMVICCNAPTDPTMRLSSRHTLLHPLSFHSSVYLYLYLNPERDDEQRLVILVRLLYSLVSLLIFLFVLGDEWAWDCHYFHYLMSLHPIFPFV